MEEDDYYSSSSAPQQLDLEIRINGCHTFFLNKFLAASFSQTLRKLIKQEKRRRRRLRTTAEELIEPDERNNIISIAIDDFPGGPDGFEQVAEFIYSEGQIPPVITAGNLPVLYCGAVSLRIPTLQQLTEKFLEDGGGISHCSWKETLLCLQSCEEYLSLSESCGLLDQLVRTLLAKIALNSTDMLGLISFRSSNSLSSSEGEEQNHQHSRFFRVSESLGGGKKNQLCSTDLQLIPTTTSNGGGGSKAAWWFDDLATLGPKIIEKVIKSLGAYGTENNSLLLTRFLLHYLKTISQNLNHHHKSSSNSHGEEYGGLADTAVYGVVLMGKTAFSSCRALFGVLRVVSGFGLSKGCRIGLERLIGSVLDQAKLDDLLISGGGGGHGSGVYDVNLVVRLIRVFVGAGGRGSTTQQRLKRVAQLIDQYLREISPDQNLKVSGFIGVVQSLPDAARDCFDGVYRAIDIYLQSHPSLSEGERSRLCGCLNYKKLSLEACKDLAKNPRIPPRVAVQALAAQQVSAHYMSTTDRDDDCDHDEHYHDDCCNELQTQTPIIISPRKNPKSSSSTALVLYNNNYENTVDGAGDKSRRFTEDSEDLRQNIEMMQWRVGELEMLCKEMKGQMSKMVMMKRKKNSKPSPIASSIPHC